MSDAEEFDELAKRQGHWGGGYQAKKAMATDKVQEDLTNYGTSWSQDGKRIDPMSVYKEPVCDKDPQGCWNVRCQLGKQCKNLAQPAQPQQDESDLLIIAYQSGFYDGKKAALAQPAQEPVALVIDGVLVKSALPEKYTGHLYTAPPQREWVGLIKEDYVLVNQLCIDPLDAAELVNRLLKERNHGT